MATYNCSLHVESKMAVENVELKEQYWNTGRQYESSSALKNFPHFAQILSYFASVLTCCPGDYVILAVPLCPDYEKKPSTLEVEVLQGERSVF